MITVFAKLAASKSASSVSKHAPPRHCASIARRSMKSKRSKSTVESGTTPLTRPALAFFRGRSAPASSPVPCHTEPYVGRFAPSPTGPLHFGSLLGALASFLDARAHDGRWLVRIEDIDRPREVPGSTQSIIDCLHALCLNLDEPVLHISLRHVMYRGSCSPLL